MRFRRRSFLSAAVVGSASLPLRSRAGSGGPTKPLDVLIIGAGLTGLATAYGLRKTGLRTRILELQPRIGGRVRTVRYQWEGETVYADSGMEEYWDANPAVRMMAELGLPTRADVALSSMVMQSRLHPLGRVDQNAFLTQILEEVGMAAWRALQVRIAPMMAELSARKPSLSTLKLVDPSFADWVADQRLPSRLSEWIRISIECESGTTWDQIAAIEGLSELEIL